MKLIRITVLAMVIGFTLAACSNGSTNSPEKIYKVGETGPAGGIIFYVDMAGFLVDGYGNPGDIGYFKTYTARYIEAAPAQWHISTFPNDPGRAWASELKQSVLIPGMDSTGNDNTPDTLIGAGRKNTALIFNADSSAPAIKACVNYNNNGKADWFLPSKDELNYLYQNLGTDKVKYGLSTNNYWSSSQHSDAFAWGQHFSNGVQSNNLGKDKTYIVRAVRAFY